MSILTKERLEQLANFHGAPVTRQEEQELARIALESLEAEAVTPSDVTGPLAHAYKELTPTFMRNHIGVFERYGIYPDGSAGIQAMRIALDGMSRRAAMLQGADGTLTNEVTIPTNTPCKDAPEHIWLQTAGVWPENGEFSELTWCSDNQHPDDTLYVRADVVSGNSPVIPDGWVACSERMPKFGDYLVTDGQDFDVQMFNGEQFIPGFVWEDNITHWMPLPAAPQQEVK